MPITRRTFIKLSAGTAAGFMIGLEGCNNNRVKVCGHVYDMFGFPVEGALVTFVTGYSLKADDGSSFASVLAGPVSSNVLGEFEISLLNPSTDVAFRVTYQDAAQRITARQVTGTSIPFYDTEVWSPDTTKWINDLHDEGVLNSITIYIDPSRTHIWNFFSSRYADLMNLLQNNVAGQGESAWEGDHINPDDPSHCENPDNDHCDDHYDYPEVLDRSRKINPPWGSERGVIPFVCAEGTVYGTQISEGGDDFDGDRNWNFVVEPQYGYLPNHDNVDASLKTGQEYAMHSEMCLWFMGKKTSDEPPKFEDPKTNIKRTDDLQSFHNKRVWLMGTWTVDNGHRDWEGDPLDYHNEIHPVYWIVQFIGGWRRFCASEIVRIHLTDSGAKSIINDQLGNDPASLLETLGATFQFALITMSRTNAEQFYRQSTVHLNKFGLNCAFPNNADSVANSINESDFAQEAASLSTDQMTTNIKNRYAVFLNHLTTLGCGVYIFPSMIFIFEGTDIIQQADLLALSRPVELNTTLASRIQLSLGKQVLNLGEFIEDLNLTNLKSAYTAFFNQMKLSSKVSAEQIATYYANTSVRLVSYGMYDENDPQHSKNFSDHYNWALPRAKTDTIELINSINVRLQDLWLDAFPFARRT